MCSICMGHVMEPFLLVGILCCLQAQVRVWLGGCTIKHGGSRVCVVGGGDGWVVDSCP